MNRFLRHLLTITASFAALLALSGHAVASGYKGFERGDALITVQELKALLDAKTPKLVVIAAESGDIYRREHIPGAYLLDRPDYEAPAETQNGVIGNIIDAAGFTRVIGGLGIDRDSLVVVYDSKYDATRLWWAFTYYGKDKVRVLDGGLKSWKKAGYPVESALPAVPERPGDFSARITLPSLRVETEDIVELLRNGTGQLWDNRDIREFTGEELKKGAVRAGRIPGSVSSDWIHFKKKDNQAEWLPAAELKAVLARLGHDTGKEQYFYCQSGVRSTQAIFALYLTGWPLEKLHNYDSSWIGWSRNRDLPLATGPVTAAASN